MENILLVPLVCACCCCLFHQANASETSAIGVQALLASKALPQVGLTREQRLADAKMIVGLLETGYAPLAWKEELFGFSFEERSKELFDHVSKEITDEEFYTEIAKFISSLHDSHTRVTFPSSFNSYLPVDVDDIDNHIIVTKVYDSAGDAIKVGDELIAIDNEDVHKILKQLKEFISEGNARTEDRWATVFLTGRSQSKFPTVPTGKTTLTLHSHGDGKIKNISLEWITRGFPMASLKIPGALAGKAMVSGPKPMNALEELRWRERDAWNYQKKNSFFPLGDKFVERKNDPYPTGVIVLDKSKIGYLRIHTYGKTIDHAQAIKELEDEVGYFEDNTDALIIDQTGNNGGSSCLTFQIASFFITDPQRETPDQLRSNKDQLLDFENTLAGGELNKNDEAIVRSIIQELRTAMNNGDRLTKPHYICNNDGVMQPHTDKNGKKFVYTKPILILVDELSVSCGDSFPILMQDIERATVFGSATSGAGGAIKTIDQRIGYSEIKLSYTISLGVREKAVELPNKRTTRYIENVGAKPDIEYKITTNDFYNDYVPYRDAVYKAVGELINQ